MRALITPPSRSTGTDNEVPVSALTKAHFDTTAWRGAMALYPKASCTMRFDLDGTGKRIVTYTIDCEMHERTPRLSSIAVTAEGLTVPQLNSIIDGLKRHDPIARKNFKPGTTRADAARQAAVSIFVHLHYALAAFGRRHEIDYD